MLPILYLILIRRNGSPYPEVTVVSLPSSLMIVHSNAFVFSTSLLVVVSRYGVVNHGPYTKCIRFPCNSNLKDYIVINETIVFPEPSSLLLKKVVTL